MDDPQESDTSFMMKRALYRSKSILVLPNPQGSSKSKTKSIPSKSKSRIKPSTARLLGLSNLEMEEKGEDEQIVMANSDRSIYDELNMVFTPPRIDRKFIARFENTYKMAPTRIPDYWEARKLIERIVHSYFNDETKYQAKDMEDIVRKIAVNIKRSVKGLQYSRYKLFTITTIGEKKEQSLHIMGKYLWDFDFDRFASYTYENQYLFVIASVFMLYYE